MSDRGKLIVLAAATSESSEYLRSTWRQMLLATLPAKYADAIGIRWSSDVESWEDGTAKYVPNGLRVVEALLAEKFGDDNVVVCYPHQMELLLQQAGFKQSGLLGSYDHAPFTESAPRMIHTAVASN